MPRTREITEILRGRILAGVHLGNGGDVEKLPSVRALATEFDADHRTVLAALRNLADEGLIERRPRSGNYVALPQAWPLLPSGEDEWLVESVLTAFSRRISPRELAERLARMTTPVRQAVCIESTREHRVILCDEVHRSYGFVSSELDVERMHESRQRIAEADVIVTTMFHMPEVTAVARTLDRPVFMMTLDAGLAREANHRLSQGPVYVVATDPNVTAKLERVMRGTEYARNVRPVIVGSGNVDDIPPDAPIFIYPSAIPHVPELVRQRAKVIRYEFPETVARHLVRWLIRNGDLNQYPGSTSKPSLAESAT